MDWRSRLSVLATAPWQSVRRCQTTRDILLKRAEGSAVVLTYPASLRSEAVPDPSRPYVRHPTSLTPTPSAELPYEDHPVWARLIQGQVTHEFSYAAAGMLVFNLNLQWQRDPLKLPLLIKQIRTFFQKYQHLLGGDVQELFS